MKYSVIIPVYNAAKTVRRCLDSLLGQLGEDAEILLINDGSTDESGEICRDYAQQYDCVRYCEKENGGVSSARNMGLDMACGEYVLFVDSDDYVTEDYFSVINAVMERCEPDMLVFGLRCFGAGEGVWQTGSFFSDDRAKIAKFARNASYAYLYSNLMTKTFRRSILLRHGLRFDESLRIGEDHAFVFAYTVYVRRMISVENVIYNYSRENSNSLSRCSRPNLAEQLLRVSELMRETLRTAELPGAARRFYIKTVSWFHYHSAYSACKELRKFISSASDRRAEIRRICDLYASANIRPAGLHSHIIALPVRFRMSRLIDAMSAQREFYRKHAG